jgi:hypothetical protein
VSDVRSKIVHLVLKEMGKRDSMIKEFMSAVSEDGAEDTQVSITFNRVSTKEKKKKVRSHHHPQQLELPLSTDLSGVLMRAAAD